MPSSTTRLRVACERAVATIVRAAPYSRAARAIDPPIRPTPISASLSMTGADAVTRILQALGALPPPLRGRDGEGGRTGLRRREPQGPPPLTPPRKGEGNTPRALWDLSSLFHHLGEGRDDELVRLFGADAHAQRIRQMIGADRAQHAAARGEQRVGVLRGPALGLGEMDQDEVADARRDLEAELRDLVADPGEPPL